jgi:hypothetical protein
MPAIRVFFAPGFLHPADGAGISADDFPDQVATVVRLQKVGLLVDRLALDTDAVDFIMKHGAAAGLPDLSALPSAPIPDALPPGTLDAWELLMALVRADAHHFRGLGSVSDVLRYPLVPSHTRAGLLELCGAVTGWEPVDLAHVTGPDGLNLTYPEDYLSATWLVKLADTMPMVARIGAAAQQLSQWTAAEVTQAHADSVRHAVKAKYGNDRWLEITTPLRDRIREQQRDALLAFVLHHRRKHDQSRFQDVDDLYAYYLIDPQMSACAMTSRTLLASSSVQLFVQRIMLNLEPGMSLSREHAREWKWRKQYRVWEANRKVFLWPENWIEPELRDDKSPFFHELENELHQDELNEETVERAYTNYLYKLHEVARLSICGVHYEKETKTLHVFGRTAGDSPVTYYRRWENGREWTPWEKVELEIHNAEGVEAPQKGVLLLPVIHNRRLFLFWPIFTLKNDELTIEDEELIKKLDEHIAHWDDQILNTEETYLIPALKVLIRNAKRQQKDLQRGRSFYALRMAYSQYRQGHWTATKVTAGRLKSPHFRDQFMNADRIDRHLFVPVLTGGELLISWYYMAQETGYKLKSRFRFDSCRDELTALHDEGFDQLGDELYDWMEYRKYREGRSDGPLRITDPMGQQVLLLSKTPGRYLLSLSLHDGFYKIPTPFFYEDDDRTFVVTKTPMLASIMTTNTLASTAVAGTASSLQGSAYTSRLIEPVKERLVEAPARMEDAQTASAQYFGVHDANRVVIRPANRLSGETAAGAGNELRRVESRIANPGGTALLVNGGFHTAITFNASGEYLFQSFHHPYVCLFLKQLNRFGLEGLLDPDPTTTDGRALARQLTPDHPKKFSFVSVYQPNHNELRYDPNPPQEVITFDHVDAYAAYNWELFFHIPLLIATRLHQDQRFAEAQRWFHYIFDPTETEGDAPYRFWKIKPFHTYTQKQMEADMKQLLAGKAKAQILAWQEDPFNPHLLARFRRLAYMKTTVMKYLDNLIAWGDHLFRQDSIESINEATQLYLLAGQILGKLPVATEAKDTEVKSFSQLAAQLDALGNAWVEIESSQLGASTADMPDAAHSSGVPDLVPYFCFSPNERLLSYWDSVADRLFKIRHCMNIEGVVRQLPLFQPPIDPALLVRAAAAGMDLSSAVSDLYAPLPHYRFAVMIQKAQELCQELKSLGGALLSALEKKDAEALALMRSGQETELLTANREIRAHQIGEAKHHLESLNEALELASIRYEDYRDRDFISDGEATAVGLSIGAAVFQAISGIIASGAGGAKLFPDYTYGAHAQGWASGTSFSSHITGGDKTGGGLDSAAKAMDVIALVLREAASTTSTFAQYGRRKEDWDLQRDLAKQEMKQIEKQSLAAEVRIAIAERERDNLELQIAQSQTVADFMKNKYTHQQLYGWMVGQLASVFFQTYRLAYDVAKQAEKCFRHEMGIETSNYIRFGYWDNLRKGLLAGEKLSLDLKRLELAYLEQNRREYELTKHISVRQLNPVALLNLKATGACEVTLPEWLFDLDGPGHYMRRLKNVSLSIPSVVGPYTSINCTLSLLRSSVRKSANLKDGEYARQDSEDDRFVDYFGTIQSIVTSSGNNDGGMFETNLRDERFLPFENAGAVSTWKLELPADFRQFDYDTISDVILHLRYTARQGGAQVRRTAVEHIEALIKELSTSGLVRMFSLRHDFPSEWHRFVTGSEDFRAIIKKDFFPYFVQGKNIDLEAELYAVQDGDLSSPTSLDLANLADALNEQGAFELTVSEGSVLERDKNAHVFLAIRYAVG